MIFSKIGLYSFYSISVEALAATDRRRYIDKFKIEMKKIDYKAVAIGTLVDLGATIIFVVFVGLIIGLNSISMPLNLIIGLSCITLGGYVAAKIATMSKLFNATLVGVGGIVLGLPFYSDFPTWYSISSIILMPPSAYLGGIIRLKKI